MKTFAFLSIFIGLLASNFAAAELAFVRQEKFPLSWIKQKTSDSWSLVKGFTGPSQLNVALVQVKEEPQGRKLASTDEVAVQYKLVEVKKSVNSVTSEQIKGHQIQVTITAP